MPTKQPIFFLPYSLFFLHAAYPVPPAAYLAHPGTDPAPPSAYHAYHAAYSSEFLVFI
jgi:hypothetical protein